jgi:hypothetical protein
LYLAKPSSCGSSKAPVQRGYASSDHTCVIRSQQCVLCRDANEEVIANTHRKYSCKAYTNHWHATRCPRSVVQNNPVGCNHATVLCRRGAGEQESSSCTHHRSRPPPPSRRLRRRHRCPAGEWSLVTLRGKAAGESTRASADETRSAAAECKGTEPSCG